MHQQRKKYFWVDEEACLARMKQLGRPRDKYLKFGAHSA